VVVVKNGWPKVVLDVQAVVGGGGTTHAGTATGWAGALPTVTLRELSPGWLQVIWKRTLPSPPVV
jgi:hypothetical protein